MVNVESLPKNCSKLIVEDTVERLLIAAAASPRHSELPNHRPTASQSGTAICVSDSTAASALDAEFCKLLAAVATRLQKTDAAHATNAADELQLQKLRLRQQTPPAGVLARRIRRRRASDGAPAASRRSTARAADTAGGSRIIHLLLGDLEGALVLPDLEKLHNALLVRREPSDLADKLANHADALAKGLRGMTSGASERRPRWRA